MSRLARVRDSLGQIKYRVAGAYAILLILVLTMITLQFVVSERLQQKHAARDARIDMIREANRELLQHMTDAETGVRGFQGTGNPAFLEPYHAGRAGAAGMFAQLDAAITDDDLRRLLSLERDAVADWTYAYAIPIVNAGVADTDPARFAHGKEIFDRIRTANADMDAEIDSQTRQGQQADQDDRSNAQLMFAVLAVLILVTGLCLAMVHQRHLLAPLEQVRRTLRQLTHGELSARAAVTGPPELRAVAESVNELADRTERLIAAEQARAAGNDLLAAVAAELKSERSLAATSERIAELVGDRLGAEAVHSRITVDRGATVAVAWPAEAEPPSPGLAQRIRAAKRLTVIDPEDQPGVLGISLGGDADNRSGLLHVVRRDRPVWSDDERTLLLAVAAEIDHAVRQDRLRLRQDRLIAELRTLDEQKDVFVSTVTHELRTPLTSIVGYTEMVLEDEDDPLTDGQRRGLAAVRRNAHRLQATVSDLLLLDKSAAPPDAEAVPVDLAELAAGLHRDLDAAARAKDLRSELAAQPAWVRGDGARLKRALRYLMENAIKFTPAGGSLECKLTTDGRTVVVSITDTGIGIPPADVPGLFTPFHRATNAMDQAVQGNGLGLAIVRTIVTEHGGTVAAHSELGQGSTFTMTLPALPAGSLPPPVEDLLPAGLR